MINVRTDGRVATVLLERPKVNALSPELVAELDRAVTGVLTDSAVGAVVLGSAVPGVFCAGFDLSALGALGGEAFERFFDGFARLYRRLFGAPVPVVAAVDGHALAGGAILALACDRRVFGRGTWGFGLNEVDLGLPLPAGVVRMLRVAAGPGAVYEACALGRVFPPEVAAGCGLASRLVDPGTALEAAAEDARELATKPREALAEIRRVLRGDDVEALARLDHGVGAAFRRWWTSPACTERRQALLARLAARRSGEGG